MKKFLSTLWLPITAGFVIILIYGSLAIADLKIKNQKFEEKQNELQTKITQLEKEFSGLTEVQVAGIKNEQPKTKKVASTAESATTATPQPSPTPMTTATATPTTTATPTSIPTPSPSPTPTPTPTLRAEATVAIEGVGTYQVELESNDTAFSILIRAGQENSFRVEYQMYEDLGAFVTCIGGICGHDNYYWAFYYNGHYSMVGASSQKVSAGDETAWKFESF